MYNAKLNHGSHCCFVGSSNPNEWEGLLIEFCPCISHWKAENKTSKRMVYKSKRVIFHYDEGKLGLNLDEITSLFDMLPVLWL
jgi:hypothetical protein